MLLLKRIPVLGGLVYYGTLLGWFWIMFRMLSRNLPKRRAENEGFLRLTAGIRSEFRGKQQRMADKDHKYFTCKTCGAICRVPAGKGKIIITCPRCHGQISGKS